MTRDPDEHYVVSLAAFNELANIADAIGGVAQLTSGRLADSDPEISRVELAAVFRAFSQQLHAQLRALPHRPSEGTAA